MKLYVVYKMVFSDMSELRQGGPSKDLTCSAVKKSKKRFVCGEAVQFRVWECKSVLRFGTVIEDGDPCVLVFVPSLGKHGLEFRIPRTALTVCKEKTK